MIVLAGAGAHFCAGHDIGTPGRDVDQSFDRKAVLWWDHVGKPGADGRYAREMEVYLGMCRRWREMPKPSIAMVQGACIAGGLMLAWVCDLIVASDDAFFADPVVRMGIPGVEYFAHPWVLGPRFAKEVLFTGDRFGAERAYELGMVNRVVPRAELAEATFALAGRIAAMPPFGLALAKRAVNQCEDQMGLRPGMEARSSACTTWPTRTTPRSASDSLAGMDARAMKRASGMSLGRRAGVPDRGPRLAGRPRARPAAAVGGHRGRASRAHRDWERELAEARLAVVSWPARYGGRDAPLAEWLVFEEEYYAAGGPVRVGQNGLFLLAPTLFAHGTDEQRDRLLPPMAPAPMTSGRRPGPSPTQAATWPRMRSRGLRARGRAGCCPGRRPGARGPPSPTGPSACSAPTRGPSGIAA